MAFCTRPIAIGGYILGYGLGEQSGERQAHSDTYARHAAEHIEQSCSMLDGSAQTECIVRVVEATNEQERAQDDLNAQKNMARWALLMLVATVAMAFVTAGGVYYVWRTLQTTREIGEAQVRSYIYPSCSTEQINIEANTISIEFQNYGNSPGSISFVDCALIVSDPYACQVLWSEPLYSEGFTVAPQGCRTEAFKLNHGRALYVRHMLNKDGVAVCVQGNFQSVDVFKHVHKHAIDITLSDGVRDD